MSMLSGFCWTVVFCWSNKDIQFWFSNKLKSNEHTPTCQLVLTKQVSPEFSEQLVNFGSFFISLFMTQLSFCNHLFRKGKLDSFIIAQWQLWLAVEIPMKYVCQMIHTKIAKLFWISIGFTFQYDVQSSFSKFPFISRRHD